MQRKRRLAVDPWGLRCKRCLVLICADDAWAGCAMLVVLSKALHGRPSSMSSFCVMSQGCVQRTFALHILLLDCHHPHSARRCSEHVQLCSTLASQATAWLDSMHQLTECVLHAVIHELAVQPTCTFGPCQCHTTFAVAT